MNDCYRNASCVNTQGSYNCSCNSTYIGNGFICEGKSIIFRLRNLIIYVFLNVTKERTVKISFVIIIIIIIVIIIIIIWLKFLQYFSYT